ncbi:MAG: phosphoesterase [Methanocorpusculum sp.]|nr:phosphoesterase [Methanocorpusculum sp.]
MPLCKHKPKENKPTLQEKIVSRNTNIIHLTHNDLDAAGCDAVCRIKFGEEIFTIFSSVGRFNWFFSQIGSCSGKGDSLIISDIGYQKGVLESAKKAKAAGWKIYWFDHHKWTDEEKSSVEPYVEKLTVDTSKCATGVVYAEYASGNSSAAEFAKVVCDYDLWKHEDKRSAILGIITAGQKNLELVRDKFIKGVIVDDEINAVYKKINDDKNKCIKKSLNAAKIFEGKYKIAVMPAFGYPSETAAEARKTFSSDIELLVFDNGKFSLRSVPDISHLIAKEFNGGGHPNASGGSFAYGGKERLLLKLFKKVSRADKFVSTAEKY